jgi:N-acetylglucosamine-6-sulfatase
MTVAANGGGRVRRRDPSLRRRATVAAIAAVLTSSTMPALAATSPPNVVVIVTDDQRYGTVRWMPAVRKLLVERGTTFTNAYVPTPTCCPSRASLLTGLLAQGTGVWANGGSRNGEPIGGWRAFHRSGMERRTVATWLTKTYRTILVGKYLNGYDEAGRRHVPEGWDRWHAFFEPNGTYYGYRLVHTNGNLTSHGWNAADYSTDVFARLAVQEIRDTPRRKPLLLFFTPYAPHNPATPAPRHARLGHRLSTFRAPSVNEGSIGDKPPWIRALHPVDRSGIAVARANAFASLRAVDEAVAVIVKTLKRTRRLHRTLIIFTSDNGVSWGEHRIPVQNKFVPYEAQTHVPLVLRWDGHANAGARLGRLVMNADVPATIAEATGVSVGDLDGLPLLGRERHGALLYSAGPGHTHDGNGIWLDRPAYCGLRTKRYLYVRYASGHEELYDYRRDPYELKNRAGRPAFDGIRRKLRARLRDACVPAPPGY